MSLISQSHLFFQDETPRPLGRLTLAGQTQQSGGVGHRNPRVYGRYALVIQAGGGGVYRDANGVKKEVTAGDAILIFPALSHSYGPRASGRWDEIYVCFDGPIFDLWQRENLLNSSQPLHRVSDLEKSVSTLRILLEEPRPATVAEHLEQLNRFLAFLGETLSFPPLQSHSLEWLERAKMALSSDLGGSNALQDAASAAGMSYENFRKAFARETGVSPSKFRDQKRLEAAQTLLLRGEMTNAVIARSLGFRDESHFSRRFKQLSQQTPRDFRRAGLMKE
jgi:AraC-like DNA-binding protein